VDHRIHILEGRNIVFLNIDKVIRVIRNSDEPKPELMQAFKLTAVQSEDILEIRLRSSRASKASRSKPSSRSSRSAQGVEGAAKR
jgi:topoisomerase-4 subunit A